MSELHNGPGQDPIEIVPVVVLSQAFPARPSSIPDIRDFVRRCLAESPLNEDGTREVGATVFRALLDAAGATGSIQVSFRIFPDHVEVDVLHSDTRIHGDGASAAKPPAAAVRSGAAAPAATWPGAAGPAGAGPGAEGLNPTPRPAATFAEWMASALRREGLTHEAAARQLGVSVKTVGRWVGGETEPRMRDLRRIQELFGELPFP